MTREYYVIYLHLRDGKHELRHFTRDTNGHLKGQYKTYKEALKVIDDDLKNGVIKKDGFTGYTIKRIQETDILYTSKL